MLEPCQATPLFFYNFVSDPREETDTRELAAVLRFSDRTNIFKHEWMNGHLKTVSKPVQNQSLFTAAGLC